MKQSYFSKLIIPIVILLGGNMSVLAQTVFPVPNVPGCRGVSGVIVNMRGGAGGSSNSSGTSFPNGGPGGYGGSIVCTLDVQTPVVITSLTYYVGQAGAVGTPVLTGLAGSAGGPGYGTGGGGGTFAGPSGSIGTNCPGGGGGGSSAVLNTTGGAELFVAAGGGGGGALITSLNGGNGGNPGTAGANAGTYNFGGAGGTPGAGGAAGGVGLNNNGMPGGPLPPGNGGTGGMGLQGSQSGGGGGAGWGGGGGGGAGNRPGTGSTIGVNTATGAGGGGSNYVNPTCVTTGLANGTASVMGNGAVTLTLYPAAIGGTCISICAGTTTTFTETTPGGVWSSSNTAIASVSSTTGSPVTVTAGTTVGTANISYTVAGGYYAFVAVTVLAAPSPISGPTNVCQGNTIPLSDAVPGGVWNTANTTVATVGASTGVVTGVSAGNAVISYTSPGGCPTTYTITVTTQPDPIAGVTVCAGSPIVLSSATPGGDWTSSNSSVATIDATTGIGTGIAAGTSTVTYSFGGTCYTTTVVTVLTGGTPITGLTYVCEGNTITLSDSMPGGVWSTANTTIATVANAGVVTGVSAGNATITYTAPGFCPAMYAIVVNTQPAPFAGVAVCAGSAIVLTDATPGGNWSSNNSSVATIDPLTGSGTGVSAGTTTITYAISYSSGGTCYTTSVVTVNAIPVISADNSKGLDSCGVVNGKIELIGLTPGSSYTVAYDYHGGPAPVLTLPAAPVTITSLDSGTYTNFVVTDVATGCTSLPYGPIVLSGPTIPPAPVVTSQPLCDLKTLYLLASDALQGGTYSWTGPDNFTSNIQNPSIVGATYANTGTYTVTYSLKNCVSPPSTTNVTMYALSLVNVSLDQTIFYGATVQLNAENAIYYTWVPNDGTIDNPNINNPVAAPLKTTVYTVYGMDQYGCLDTASVTITVDSTTNTGIPSAFTPNGDGLNDVFRPVGIKYQRLVDFRIYNRWGQQVFYSNNKDHGWDGTSNGVPQDMGVYYYQIIVAQPGNMDQNISYKGNVTLVR